MSRWDAAILGRAQKVTESMMAMSGKMWKDGDGANAQAYPGAATLEFVKNVKQ